MLEKQIMSVERESRPWYEKWFGEHYLEVYSHRDEEDARIQAELIAKLFPPGQYPKMLDLCCGEGRHARIFSGMGYSVTGVDLSSQMVKAARDNSPPEAPSLILPGFWPGFEER